MIYLDYAASTPCDKRVITTMLPFFDTVFANPSNITNDLGLASSNAVEAARNQIATHLNCTSDKITWTSGATEANNLAILGTVIHYKMTQPSSAIHLITNSIEHKSVLVAVNAAKTIYGCEVTIVEPTVDGVVDPMSIKKAIRKDTRLVSLMMANNEIGTLNDIISVANICSENQILMHTDATQCFGKIPINVKEIGVDLLSFSGHKLYGPKGVGGLFIKNPSSISPLLYGGGQENGLRSGTLNVANIVGLGKAYQIAHESIATEMPKIKRLRDVLENRLIANCQSIVVNGGNTLRLPNISSVTFNARPGIAIMNLITEGKVIACSSGAACDSADNMPSHVMTAIGKTRHEAKNTLRFSLGRFTTVHEIEACAEYLSTISRSIR
jgi:cysteine desulfurase